MKLKDTKSQMRSKIRWGVVGILALMVVTGFFVAPAQVNKGINKINEVTALGFPRIPEKPFSLGLDLQGGAHLVYQADVSAIDVADRPTSVEGVRDVIERRVNGLGVGEPSIQTTRVGADYRIIVELPGITDVNEAISMIGETPILEFREENDEPPRELTEEEQKEIDDFNVEAGKKFDAIRQRIKDGEEFAAVASEVSDDEQSKNNGGYVGFVTPQNAFGEVYDWAKDAKDGDISDTRIETPVGYHILKRGGERAGEQQVEAKHILLCYLGAEHCDNPTFTKDEARARAQEIFEEANADNFEELAKANSTDVTTAENGGDLGSFAQGVMVEAFDKAVFSAEAGQILGPVETPFGFHIIYKVGQSAVQEYELSHIVIAKRTATDVLGPQDAWKLTDLSGAQLDRAEVVSDPQTGAVQVSLQFNGEGRDLFKDITQRNIGKPVAIYLDGQPISVPTVQQAITDGRAVITGGFTVQEARLLAQRLNAGALPVPVDLISQQSIGATLGAESLAKSLKAGIAGLILVMIFMLLYYRLPGLLSVIALALYVSLTLAIFKLIGVTLTLAGIAGLILSIGMAVDANILIFERLKEELKEGKSLRTGVEEGFLRAWTAIRDGNVSTLFTCVLLIWFGSSFVQGFAVTLAIGVLISMFSAITVSRVLLRFVAPWFEEKGQWLFLGAQKK